MFFEERNFMFFDQRENKIVQLVLDKIVMSLSRIFIFEVIFVVRGLEISGQFGLLGYFCDWSKDREVIKRYRVKSVGRGCFQEIINWC